MEDPIYNGVYNQLMENHTKVATRPGESVHAAARVAKVALAEAWTICPSIFLASTCYDLRQFVAFCCRLTVAFPSDLSSNFCFYFLIGIWDLHLGQATSHGVAVCCERRRNDTVASNSCSRRSPDREVDVGHNSL